MNRRLAAMLAVTLVLTACKDDPSDPGQTPPPPVEPVELSVLAHTDVPERFTSEVAASGTWVYTGTWSMRGGVPGNVVKVWNAADTAPVLVDSLVIQATGTTGDVQISDDGSLLVIASEGPGALNIFDRSNPAKPTLLARLTNTEIARGVHTVKLGRAQNKHYAFLSIDPNGNNPARLIIVDITNPATPTQVYSQIMGAPYVHDVHVRAGLLFTALWNDGMTIWDIGAQGTGTAAAPRQLGNLKINGCCVHNIFWFNDPTNSSKKYVFIGEEGPGGVGSTSSGDIHVIDVSNFAAPREVAFYHVNNAGVHNFAADEQHGILYAAYYNAGVRALDIRGDLGNCAAAEKAPDGRCDLGLMKRERAFALNNQSVYVWGVSLSGSALYASDMLAGLWKLNASPLQQ
jgi:hypothetical protein